MNDTPLIGLIHEGSHGIVPRKHPILERNRSSLRAAFAILGTACMCKQLSPLYMHVACLASHCWQSACGVLPPTAQDQLECTGQLLDRHGQSLDRSMLMGRILDARLKSGCAALKADAPPDSVSDAIKRATKMRREFLAQLLIINVASFGAACAVAFT